MRVVENCNASQRELVADPREDRRPVKEDDVAGLQRDEFDFQNQIRRVVEGESQESRKGTQEGKKNAEDEPEFEKYAEHGTKRYECWTLEQPDLRWRPGQPFAGQCDEIVQALSRQPVSPPAAELPQTREVIG